PLDFARFVDYAFSGIAEVTERLDDGLIRRYWSAADLAAAGGSFSGSIERSRTCFVIFKLPKPRRMTSRRASGGSTPTEDARGGSAANPLNLREPSRTL